MPADDVRLPVPLRRRVEDDDGIVRGRRIDATRTLVARARVRRGGFEARTPFRAGSSRSSMLDPTPGAGVGAPPRMDGGRESSALLTATRGDRAGVQGRHRELVSNHVSRD